jgi:2-iminobutanoate/2-iminopropanoate deaminase
VITGGVHGLSNAPGATNELADQVPRMFDNLRRILEAAGATFDDVVRMTVYVRNGEVRAAVNGPWVAAFPDAASRPARHTLVNEQLPAPMLVQCDATAYVSGGE